MINKQENKLILPSLNKFEEDLINNEVPMKTTAEIIFYRIEQYLKRII